MIIFTRFSQAMGRINTERKSLEDLEAFQNPQLVPSLEGRAERLEAERRLRYLGETLKGALTYDRNK
ncbi:MAG: hypothetical protein C0507_25635 [Cyanobacteria bacterium PR.3.49]|nr:hypothetical protein [Cyanobacteria bacterium PR.3.49]